MLPIEFEYLGRSGGNEKSLNVEFDGLGQSDPTIRFFGLERYLTLAWPGLAWPHSDASSRHL